MLVSPMAERNKELILEVLADYVDNTSQAFGLELASGTGQHVVHFAQALPNVTWQPSEVSPSALLASRKPFRSLVVLHLNASFPECLLEMPEYTDCLIFQRRELEMA
uniref:Methyltransferase like 26 n=1 Tax=Chelonoidis abingdonii TaxID=106734 RepID=A0A8C0G870_CHEAB